MKKIILFIDNLGSGGAQRQIVNLAIILKKRGYDISVLVYADQPFYKRLLDEHGIAVHLISARDYLKRIIKVRKYLRSSAQDVVIAFLETPGFLASVSKIGNTKWKLITSERSARESSFYSKRNRVYNLFERFSDAKVCNSVNALRLWKRHYPQYADKYCVIYNPVIIPQNYLVSSNKQDNKRCLVVAASYQELKNPLGLIEALRSLDIAVRSKLEIHWYGRTEVAIGNTRIYEEACKRINDYQLKDCISLHSETNEIYKIMSESTAVGLFSKVEGLPNTICEAMMLGKPVIMSRVSDYDVLVDGNGFLCDPNSYESISAALCDFVKASDQQLKDMGEKSRELAEKYFLPDKVAQQWIDLIEN